MLGPQVGVKAQGGGGGKGNIECEGHNQKQREILCASRCKDMSQCKGCELLHAGTNGRHKAVTDLQRKILDAPPSWSKFPHVHRVLGKIWSNNRLVSSLRLVPSWETLGPPWCIPLPTIHQ